MAILAGRAVRRAPTTGLLHWIGRGGDVRGGRSRTDHLGRDRLESLTPASYTDLLPVGPADAPNLESGRAQKPRHRGCIFSHISTVVAASSRVRLLGGR